MTLSVCLIVKDEEEVLKRCLGCVEKFADEIVIVDTGSRDGTVDIAKNFTDKVYFFEWCDDFSAARNFAFGKATCDYVMWLDADDVVTDENCALIKELVSCGGFDMAYLVYAAAFDGDVPVFVYNRERIFRRSAGYRFSGAVHEAVSPRGKAVYSAARIDHRKISQKDPMRNLKIYLGQIARGGLPDSRSRFYYGRELMFNGMYAEAAAVLAEFLKGDGWTENKIEACFNLMHCYERLGDAAKAREALLKTLEYDRPRAQFCCILGGKFMQQNNYPAAVYWYTCALGCKRELALGGFVNADYSEFIPCMQLCVLYDRLGDLKRACAFNERAGRVKPQNENYLRNVRYFRQKLSGEVNNE